MGGRKIKKWRKLKIDKDRMKKEKRKNKRKPSFKEEK